MVLAIGEEAKLYFLKCMDIRANAEVILQVQSLFLYSNQTWREHLSKHGQTLS